MLYAQCLGSILLYLRITQTAEMNNHPVGSFHLTPVWEGRNGKFEQF